MALRRASIDNILSVLDTTIFTRHLFNCPFNVDESTLVKIVYTENKNFTFIAKYGYDIEVEEYRWETDEAPGEHFLTPEHFTCRDFKDFLHRLTGWTGRILQEETSAGTLVEHIENLRKRLFENADKMDQPERPFDAEEAQRYREKLDALYNEIDSMKAEHKIASRDLWELKQGFEALKSQIDKIPRKTWMKAAGNKLLDFVLSIASKAGGELVTKAATTALFGPDSSH